MNIDSSAKLKIRTMELVLLVLDFLINQRGMIAELLEECDER